MNLEWLREKVAHLGPVKTDRILESFAYHNLSLKCQFEYEMSFLSPEEQEKALDELGPIKLAEINNTWKYTARPKQLPPSGSWRRWVICSGRGWGKTQVGINYIVEQAMKTKGDYLVVGRVDKETQQNQFEPITAELERRGVKFGKAGQKKQQASLDRRVMEINLLNGSRIFGASGMSAADSARGKNLKVVWCDEIASYDDPEDALRQIDLATRAKGSPLRTLITTTPRGAGTKLLQRLKLLKGTIFITGSAYENLDNLAPEYIDTILEQENTKYGSEEVWAELLDDTGVIWKASLFRITNEDPTILFNKMERIVVAYDPAVSNTDNSAEHGIVVAGMMHNRELKQDEYYVLADYSLRADVSEAVQLVCNAYNRFKADCVCVEVNNGGDFLEKSIHSIDKNVPVKKITATRGKELRASPVLMQYEKQRVFHTSNLWKLEQEMCSYDPRSAEFRGKKSPGRIDSLVYAITDLMNETGGVKAGMILHSIGIW